VAREYVAFVLHRAAKVFIYFFAGRVARENVAFVLHRAVFIHGCICTHTHTHTQTGSTSGKAL
jgi:hypothetical protein